MTPKREKVEVFTELLAQLLRDHEQPVKRTETMTGSAMIQTTFEDQPINIVITAARR